MRRRQRKLVGTVATIVFVIGYALVAMMLAQLRFTKGAPDVWQWLFYGIVGMGWILPLMPLIRWMERPDEG